MLPRLAKIRLIPRHTLVISAYAAFDIKQTGRARPLCPGNSDINLFCYSERIIDFDPKISDRAFDLGMPE
jgi:hypothetical protein